MHIFFSAKRFTKKGNANGNIFLLILANTWDVVDLEEEIFNKTVKLL